MKASASLVSDSDQADVEVGGASRFLLTERIPNFVEQLDLMKTFLTTVAPSRKLCIRLVSTSGT